VDPHSKDAAKPDAEADEEPDTDAAKPYQTSTTPPPDDGDAFASEEAIQQLWEPATVIEEAAILLEEAGMLEVKPRTTSRVPIVLFRDPETGKFIYLALLYFGLRTCLRRLGL
jgi:hypothetical protein